MRTLRLLSLAPVALALTAAASAQFDGPAPLAWRWIQPTSVPPSGSPLVVNDKVFAAVGSRVYAIDRATGNKLWQYPQVDPINGVFRTAPVMVGGLLIAAADNKIVYAIDPATGQSKWTYTSPSPFFGAPVSVSDGKYVAVATSDNTLIAIDSTTGKPLWAPYKIYDRIQGQIASYGNGIVFFNGLNELRSLDAVSKTANYKRPAKFISLPPGATPVLYGETFYVVSDRYLVGINAASGTAKFNQDTKIQLTQSPVPSADGVLVVSRDGEAMVFDPLNGRPVGATKKGPMKLGSFPSVRPSLVGNKFLVPTTNGAINLLDPTTGALLWSYLVRPIGDQSAENNAQNQNGGLGPGGRNGGAPGGRPGGGQGGLGGSQNSTPKAATSLLASGPAVLAGQTLLVPAVDGSILAFDKELGVDLTPPEVKQLWPNPGDVVSGQPPLELIFRLRDEAAGINESTIKVEIDGESAGFTYTRDGFVRVAFTTLAASTRPPGAKDGAFLPGDVPKPNPTLQEGRHSVVVTATDWLGNVAKTTYSVVIDNSLPPLPLPGSDQTGQNQNGGLGGPGGRGGGGGRGADPR